jgi:hypothetical protein
MYPWLIAAAGFVVSSLFRKSGLKQMRPEAKTALKDSYEQSRGLAILTGCLYILVGAWRPTPSVAWIFFGCLCAVENAWAIFRLRRLNLPELPFRYLLAEKASETVGIVSCATIFAIKGFR